MKKINLLLALLLLALAALACRAAERASEDQAEAVSTHSPTAEQPLMPQESPAIPTEAGLDIGGEAAPSPAPTGAGEVETQSPAQSGALEGGEPPPPGKPPQSQRAEVRPAELRAELSRLTGLIGFQVLDQEGAVLGSVADFVINTCETYIIYFLLAPTEGLGAPVGSRLVAPFEAVTINTGVLDAQSDAILLSLAAGHFAHAPAFPEGQELVPVDWEAEVREYWSQYLRLSNLTTGCRVSASGGGTTEIHKVAYASELIGAELRDGLQNLLGSVEEMILEPESGKVSFFVVRLQDEGGLVLVPLRVVNIPKEALEPGSKVSLVLLTENTLLLNAPRIQSVEEAVEMSAQGTARSYWGR